MPEEPANSFLPSDSSPVKKHKRGDIREDGKVFLFYQKECRNGEYWVTKEVFEAHRKSSKRAAKKWRQANIEQARECTRKWRQANIEKAREQSRRWYMANREESIARMREWRKENIEKQRESERRWRQKNKDKLRAAKKQKLKSAPTFALAEGVRIRVADSLRSLNVGKTYRLREYLGCSTEELKEHLEKQFLPGMSWENRSLWHIDHIVPLGLAKTAEEVYALNHYTNLRPLWAKDNRSKNKRLPDRLPEYIDARIQAIYQNARKQNV